VPTSSVIPIFGTQSGENTFILPSSITTIDYDNVSNDDLPIALCESKHTHTSHSIFHFVSYSHLSPSFHVFSSFLDSYFVSKFI